MARSGTVSPVRVCGYETLMKSLPNILTSSRLVMALFMFVALAAAAGAVPWVSDQLTAETQLRLERWAFYAFVVAAVTDFFDGWLARKLDAVSVWGAILDPIGDKILVCGALLGLMALGPNPLVVLPAGLILFREFTGQRPSRGRRGQGRQVTCHPAGQVEDDPAAGVDRRRDDPAPWLGRRFGSQPSVVGGFTLVAHGLLWLATLVTLITGAQYWEAARKALA